MLNLYFATLMQHSQCCNSISLIQHLRNVCVLYRFIVQIIKLDYQIMN